MKDVTKKASANIINIFFYVEIKICTCVYKQFKTENDIKITDNIYMIINRISSLKN